MHCGHFARSFCCTYGRWRGFDYVATGHYARVEQYEVTGRYLLKKALDASKDQSYVLYTMTQEQLAHTLFPLDTLKIVFDMPQRAVAKGQSVVLYDGETVVGGGIIVETFPESCYNESKSHGGQQV